jgi:surface protein
MEWSTDILVLFLHALDAQCDSAAHCAWHKLAFLTCKQDALARVAKVMPRPILLRIKFDSTPDGPMVFKIPFMQATVVCVDVNWGDGCVDKLREKGAGYAQHKYAAPGEYHVRIFAAQPDKGDTALDHLGFQSNLEEERAAEAWWRPLREIVSFGKLGLRSLSYLFAYSGVLDADLQNLSIRDIIDLSGMFYDSKFNQHIGNWDVSTVTDMSQMFSRAQDFNQPIGKWDVGNLVYMYYMFYKASAFNQRIEDWNTGNVIDMSCSFNQAESFNQPIGKWNVSKVSNMNYMFGGAASFNQPIGEWDVGNVTDMKYMFCKTSSFNQPIGEWNVSKVANVSYMFYFAKKFNRPIGKWDTSNVTDMASMFEGASSFNQNISGWNTAKVTDMSYMFADAGKFNQPVDVWDVSNVTNMKCMFSGAHAFHQSLDKWNLSNRGELFSRPSGDWTMNP